MAVNQFLRMLFGQQGTEPTYAGLRMPRQRVEDDARLIRQGNPQERFRDYHAELPPLTETEKVAIQGDPMEAPNSRTEDNSKRDAKLKGAISGLGQIFASAMQPEQAQPLQFGQLQQQQLTPLIDPRFLRYAGGRADGGPVKRGSWAKVHKGEAVIATPDGDTVVVPKGQVQDLEDEVLPNEQTPTKGRRAVNWDVNGTAEQPVTFPDDVKEEAVLEQTVTPNSVTETVTEEPSIADVLRAKIDERQKRLAEGATKNEDGTTMYGGKKYRKRNAFDALKSAGLGVLQSLATAQVNPNDPNPLSSMLGRAIGGAAAGGVMGATMNNVDERMMDKMKIAQLTPQYEQAYGMERQKKADDMAEVYKKAQIRNLDEDNANARWGRNIQERGLAQQEKNRISREQSARMTTVAGLLKNAPEFIPGDPKFKELEQALGDVKLPVFTKDAKKKVDLKQDQRTGAWTVILTNPVTGQQEVRNVVKDGKPFTSTPTVVMQGEYGMWKQNDQQAFQGEQNQLNRDLRTQLQQSAQQFGREAFTKKAVDAYKLAFTKENGRPPTQAEIDTYITGTVESILGESGFTPLP